MVTSGMPDAWAPVACGVSVPDGDREVDIAIVGGGSAGLAAGLYAARARRRVVLFEGGVLGG